MTLRMILAHMRRQLKVVLAALSLVGGLSACGTQNITVPRSNHTLFRGAVLFHERCSGCHTLSYAATQGSAAFVRTAQFNNGPNFNVRCERPATRVLYAIENGGFSGAIMPQNVVVGRDAIDVAKFVATYSGRQAPKVPGTPLCSAKAVGALPAPGSVSTAATTTPTTTTTTPSHAPTQPKAKGHPSKAHPSKAHPSKAHSRSARRSPSRRKSKHP